MYTSAHQQASVDVCRGITKMISLFWIVLNPFVTSSLLIWKCTWQDVHNWPAAAEVMLRHASCLVMTGNLQRLVFRLHLGRSVWSVTPCMSVQP